MDTVRKVNDSKRSNETMGSLKGWKYLY